MPPLSRGVTWRLPPTCRAHRSCNSGARIFFEPRPICNSNAARLACDGWRTPGRSVSSFRRRPPAVREFQFVSGRQTAWSFLPCLLSAHIASDLA